MDMLARHVTVSSLRGLCAFQERLAAHRVATAVSFPSPRFTLVRAARGETCLFRLNQLTDMQPSSTAGRTGTAAGERQENDLGPPSPVADNPPPSAVTGQSRQTPLGKEPVATGEQGKRTRQKARKPRGRSQKECCDPLMSELPFSTATVWKELGFTSQRNKRKRGETGRVESEEDAKKKKKKETLRPNYFVSIPITNSKISEGVAEVQEAVLEKDPRLAKAMIPIGSLHITLLVTHLANQEQVDLAACALSQMEAGLAELLGGQDMVLPFSGLGTFRNEVAFIELAPGGHALALASLAELTRKAFQERGLSPGDSKDFKPHLTFMKLSRAPKLRSQGIKKLDPELYASYSHQRFGEERVVRLDLCSMLKKKTPDGYYHRDASLSIDLIHRTPRTRTSGKRASEADDAELQQISRKLVEEAVLRAVQQYKEETHRQNGGGPAEQATPPPADAINSTAAVATTTTESDASK